MSARPANVAHVFTPLIRYPPSTGVAATFTPAAHTHGAAEIDGAAIETIAGTTYTQVAADHKKWKRTTNGSAVTITIDASVNAAGDEITFEQAETVGLSQSQIVRRRFIRHRGAMVSLAMLVFIVLLAATSVGWGPIPGWWKFDHSTPNDVINEGGTPTLSLPTWLGGSGFAIGDAPFGQDSGWQASAGFGIRSSFPAGGRTTYRLDFAWPVGSATRLSDLRIRLSIGEIIGIAQREPDPQLIRSRIEAIGGRLFDVRNR